MRPRGLGGSMSSAAEAVMSATPPPPRPAADRAAAPARDAPSFSEHLALEANARDASLAQPTSEAAPDSQAASNAAEESNAQPDGAEESDTTSPDTPALLPTAQADAPTPAIIVQLIAQSSGDSPPTQSDEAASPPVNATAPSSSGKALAENDARETLPTPSNVQADALAASAALLATDEASLAEPAVATPPPQIVQQAVASITTPAKSASKATPAASSDSAEANASADAADAAKLATARATVPVGAESGAETAPESVQAPKADTQAPKMSAASEDRSVQEKLAAALENDVQQPQAKAIADRILVTSSSDAAAVQTSPELALPPVGAIGDARPTTPTSPLAVAEHAAARSAPASAQVAREIVRRFDGETTKFEMRLDPPELGRVEVRMEVTRDHKVTAVLAADSPQALTELVRHARELEQTLQSAGLELAENGLSFDLRQGGDDASQAKRDDGPRLAASESEIEDSAPVARPIGLERWRGVRVDVMA